MRTSLYTRFMKGLPFMLVLLTTLLMSGADIALATSAPGTPDLRAASDTGFSSTDNITNDTTPTFDISCTTGAMVELASTSALDPDGFVSLASASCSGGTVALTSKVLVDGSFSILASQTDAGDTSPNSSALLVTVDTVSPDVTIDQKGSQPDPTGTDPVKFDVVFSEPIDLTTFTSDDITQNGTMGNINISWGPIHDFASDSMNFELWTFINDPASGTLQPSIGSGKVKDIAGNNNTISTSTDNEVTYDSAVPVLSSLTIASSNTDNTQAKTGDTVTLTFTANEALTSVSADFTSGGDPITGSVTIASTSDDELNWQASYVVDSSDTNGAVDFTLDFDDLQGNSGAQATAADLTGGSVTVDTVAPSTPTASPTPGTYHSTREVTLSSAGSTSIRYTTNGTDPATCTGGSLYTSIITVTSTKTIKARGCDDAGNISGLGTFTYTITGTSGGDGGGGFFMPIPAASPAPSPLPPPLPPQAADAANLARFGLHEGDTLSVDGTTDPDIFIVNAWGYKRLFLNPIIFSFYGHLGGFKAVKHVPVAGRDAFPTSGLFRNCESGDAKVYALAVTGEDVGFLHWVQLSGDQAVAQDSEFFKKVFCINNNEFNWYPKSPVPYTALSQLPVYSR